MPDTHAAGIPGDWVAELADRVAAAADRRGVTGPITVASGISPSGHIHLGNLREIMVPHFVADELLRRGRAARHILSWDDYDRLRKVPEGLPASFAEHIGRPLADVPDPTGEHASWAERFKAPFRAALADLGVEVVEIDQATAYRAGTYRRAILTAMAQRTAIYDILARYQTKAAPTEADGDDDGTVTRRDRYSPYKPYCRVCDRDSTTVTAYDDASTELAYNCDCGHDDAFRLDEVDHGKLVWKVDWPMRWVHEAVVFEAGGGDHSSPGSSFTVGSQIVAEIFGGEAPEYAPYGFVGTDGAGKMSSSRGGVLTPTDALAIIEPPVLRSLYQREPRKGFTIAFNDKVANLYEEWDRLERKLADGKAEPRDQANHARSVGTATVELPRTPRIVSFRSLASAADVTNADPDQLLRVLRGMAGEPEPTSLEPFRPRLDRATTWVTTYVPAEDRTRVRTAPDADRLAGLDEHQREGVGLLLRDLEAEWNLDGLTTLVYGVPKIQLGIDPTVKERNPQLQAAQREYFILLYELLVGRDTGPRLPTLLLSIGADRVRALLTPPG